MCTLSWCHRAKALDILFNRDEHLARPAARPPQTEVIAGTRVLAPLDSAEGGTWLATNEHGLTLCLLNNYLAQQRMEASANRSRGLLLRDLSPNASVTELEAQLQSLDPFSYQPFFLIAFVAHQAPVRWCWDGRALRRTPTPGSPVSTSSLYPRLVPRLRQTYYRAATLNGLRLTPQQHLKLHRSRQPWPPAFSIAMSRGERGTVSLTRVRVTEQVTHVDYWPGDPHRNATQAHSNQLHHAAY